MRHSAICASTDPAATVEIITGQGLTGGQSDVLLGSHVSQWNVNRSKTSRVPCKPLSALMESAGLHGADFICLDVDGAEYRVLETVDLSKFKVVMVETCDDPSRNARVHQLLHREGLRLGCD